MNESLKKPGLLAGCGCASFILAIVLFGAASFIGDDVKFASPAKPEMTHYTNSREGRSGNLAEHYVDFSFDYPKSWTLKNDADNVNFVVVDHTVNEETWENLNVGYFQTGGSPAANEALYPQLIAQLQSQFAQQFPGLEKVREGKTKIGSYDAYEGLFRSTVTAHDKPVQIYTRTVLLPTPDGTKGVTLLMMGTSFHPDVKRAEDLGVKGELPFVLESFRFGE